MPPKARGISDAALHRVAYTDNDAIHRLIQATRESMH